MVYTPWKNLRLPFFMARHWTRTEVIPWSWAFGSMVMSTLIFAKYSGFTPQNRREEYMAGYPAIGDKVAEVDQKYYAMYIKQHGIDITDPIFTGRPRE